MNVAIRKPGCLSSLLDYNPVWCANTVADSYGGMTSTGVAVQMLKQFTLRGPVDQLLRDVCPLARTG